MFLILAILVASMWAIRYPDILEGAAIITTDPLPIKLKSGTGGRIFRIFVEEAESLSAAQPIAEFENNTGFENIVRLQALTDSVLRALAQDDIAQLATLSRMDGSAFGEAQGMFNDLSDALTTYTLQRSQHIYARRDANLQSRVASYQSLSVVNDQEKRLINEQVAQAAERFRSNEALFKDKVISKQEYAEEADRLRIRQLALERQRREILQNRVESTRSDEELLDLRFDRQEKESQQQAAIIARVRNLQSFIQGWRLKYLIAAPFSGRLHYLRPLQINEHIPAGEEICAVIPVAFHYTAWLRLPVYGMGKVRPGQEVQLMPDQFPANEYGYLTGRVGQIATMPTTDKDGAFYRVSIALQDTLVTSFHQGLPFSPEMSARARIITKDRNMLQRLASGMVGMQP